jgi:hypothetical protein
VKEKNSTKTDTFPPIRPPLFDVAGPDDVVIDKVNPEAMEINATSMDFTLNFTIIGAIGASSNVLLNLTLTNSSNPVETYRITTWSDWQFSITTDDYSIDFYLNNTFLTSLSLGNYHLTLYTNVTNHVSNDSIPLPMKDLRVENILIEPFAEFNNKYGEDQFFNITFTITEFDGSDTNYVQSLPKITDSMEQNFNPNVTLISADQKEINPVYFVEFVDNTSSDAGIFKFRVNLTTDVATFEKYPDATHTLVVTVTSPDGIKANASRPIDAKGTVLLVKLNDIKIGQKKPLDYINLTNDGNEHVQIRVNINESITINYEIIDNDTKQIVDPPFKVAGSLVIFQDPNRADDPFALKNDLISDDANGTIMLSANTLTPSSGYELLFYVRGHRTSQVSSPSNITIYWDLINYHYSYLDNLGESGTDSSFNQRALGIDIGLWWVLQLSVSYASDNTPALSSQMKYRFSGQTWLDLTDGASGDSLDGVFLINYTQSSPAVLLFECQVENGSIINPLGTFFVNQTSIDKNFNLTLTWSHLIIDMNPKESDRRLGANSKTEIYLTAYWAHDLDLMFEGIVVGQDWLKNELPYSLVNGEGTWTGLIQIETGNYTYSIVRIEEDSLFGITKFTNITYGSVVQVEIIWEEIIFTFSNIYNSSIPPSNKSFQDGLNFFANHGENATLFVYGIHTFDNAPFQGDALLYDWDRVDNYTLRFNEKGVAIWEGNLSDAGLPVTFSVMEITRSTAEDWGVDKVGELTDVTIAWDKIVVTFEARKAYPHGTWATVNISFDYLVFDTKTVNLSSIQYSLLFSDDRFYSVISWVQFQDYSVKPIVRYYNITSLYDPSSGLTGFETRYKWVDQEMEPRKGNLAICWYDNNIPTILELQTHELGNGTIFIVVDVTDNGEGWIGSGISNVTLFDERLRDIITTPVPLEPVNYTEDDLPEGIYRFYFKYTFNQSFPDLPVDRTRFEYNEILTFSISVTDRGTLDFPAIFGDLRNPHTFRSESFSLIVDEDPYVPDFIKKDGSFINIIYSTEDQEGTLNVTVYVKDELWSGINKSSENSVRMVIRDLDSNESMTYNMSLSPGQTITDIRSELRFDWSGILNLTTYELKVIVTDLAGNFNTHSVNKLIEDRVAPRPKKVELTPTENRQLKVTVEVEEGGLGIDYVMIQLDPDTPWYNLTRQGGIGGDILGLTQTEIYTGVIPIPMKFNMIVENLALPKEISVKIKIADLAGNQIEFTSEEYGVYTLLDPLLFHPIILITSALVFIIAIIVGIRITSRTEGYDMKQIFVESGKISRESVLTLMDEYALGVTVNFFDQVQGPVPVIWEPPLLEDQEQVMLDLSDKSFSTLEFLGLDETERSGTFDFSTGSYDCTALGYSFSVENPRARGGKENLTIVLLLRKEWGDNLLLFQDDLIEKLREIRTMIEQEELPSEVEKKARELREFVSRLMIAFNQIYSKIDYEELLTEE